MLEIKYDKDMNHNYLIVKCEEEPTVDKYQLKMITGNKIPGLIDCSTRFINGETYLYYEVNSLQTLKSLYEHKKINQAQTIRVLTGLRRVLKEIQTFLLAGSRLLLMPECLFMNWETEEIYFIYYPYGMEWQENTVQALMEFLVGAIDHQDEQLVDMVYGLYQLAERGRFVADELDHYLEKASFVSPPNPDNYEEPSQEEASSSNFTELRTEIEEEKSQFVPPIEKKQEKKFMTMALTAIGGAAIILYIQNRYLLTSQETLLSWVLLFTFLFILLITGMVYLLLRFSICSEKKPKSDVYQRIEEEEEEKKYNAAAYNDIVLEETATQRYGDTVFLYANQEVRENKLYGINKGNKYHIDLSRLPCTIGKMAGCADFCIAESSISRLHVKFTGKENTVYMTDLNSTNGTYKNGLRLQPSETVQIESGDEIRIGKLTFCYR